MSPKLALTMGDPAGIGPEILAKALTFDWLETHAVILIAVPSIMEQAFEKFGQIHISQVKRYDPHEHWENGLRLYALPEPEEPFPIGQVSAAAGCLALKSIDVAIDLCLKGAANAMVTTPVSKEAIELNGLHFDGHTGHIAKRCGVENEMMMMSHDNLNVGYVTTHLPLSKVPSHLNCALVLDRLRLSWNFIQALGIQPAKIALCGLNPHAGEGGHLGREEIEILIPALNAAQSEGIHCEGPFPSDTLFVERYRKNYGVLLALYHDQGGIPFKILAFDHGVNHTLGLPIVRTSVDHGTAWDIAWQGVASEVSLIAAMQMAQKFTTECGMAGKMKNAPY